MLMREFVNRIKIADKKAYRFASESKVLGFKVGCSVRKFRKSGINQWINEQEEKDPE